MKDFVSPEAVRKGGWSPLRRLGNLRLVVKLPLIICGLSLLVAVVLTTTAYFNSRKIVDEQIEERFVGVLHDRSKRVREVLEGAEADLQSQAGSPTVLQAMAGFVSSWNAVGANPTWSLQQEYINNNPNPEGSKDELVSSGSATQYDLVHTKYHRYFRAFLRAQGYGDALLIDASGNIIYSVSKNPDFASNLASDQSKGSPLAAAWRGALEADAGEVVFTDFSEYAPARDAVVSFLAAPVIGRDGSTLGAIAFQMPIGPINRIIAQYEGLGQTGQVFLTGSDFRLRSETRAQDGPGVLDRIEPRPVMKAALDGAEPHFEPSTGLDGTPVRAMSERVRFAGTDWVVTIEQAVSEALGPINELRNLLVLQAAGLAAVIAVLGLLFARAVARPLAGVGAALNRLREGDYATDIPNQRRGDDIGDLARNLDTLREKLAEAEVAKAEQDRRAADQRIVVDQLTGSIARLAEGDLTAKVREPFAEDYEALRNGYNLALDRLAESMASLVAAAQEIDGNAREVENASNELSQKAVEQAASLEETAAAITELSASVKSTADATGEADRITSGAKSDAEASGEEIKRAMTAMDQIATSSQKITQVTSVIEDLAFQTNLLALNAGVEAARAGEAGRGFAVVASEVRALAQRSSEAAKEINTLIHESANNVTNGVEMVEKAGKSFENLIGDFEKVSASVSSIASAAREQSVGLSEINTAVDQLDGVTQKNAAVATQVHGTGKMMVNEAAKLNRISSHFRIDPNAPVVALDAANSEPATATPKAANRPDASARPRLAAAGGGGEVMGATDVSDDVWAEF